MLAKTLTSVLLVLPLVAAPAQAAGVRGTPGAPGIGDAYFPDYGNGGYDARHYSLRLDYQPGADLLKGRATIVATATQHLSRFNLDFLLAVQEVKVNGRAAAFARTGTHELEITPGRTLAKGVPFTVEVAYADTPSAHDVPGIVKPWVKRADGALALGQPEIAWWWFPSNDHPLDKATYDIAVTVPQGTEAISNGVLTGTRTREGRTTYRWLMDKPMASYLATLFVGDLEVRQRTHRGLPVTTAYDPTLGPREQFAKDSVERTPEVVDHLASLFGRYPFHSMGGSVVNENVGFALETQTQPVYDSVFFDGATDVGVVVHENAHQWFGDSVALKRWKDIWLNEGFATYAEWLWSEKQGTGTAAELANGLYDEIPADHPRFWLRVPGDPTPEFLFYASVYWRGGMTLQALRSEVGDAVFFDILKAWARIKQHGNADTGEFVSLAEKKAGRQLDTLFQTWLYTPAKPAERPAPDTLVSTRSQSSGPNFLESHKLTHERLHGPL
ncbi:M1 family metallopeptidase [Nonomuraea sp. NPDC050663]|uniref:M1 family metallopeptidase n=1 Tax=Nonomuraea sp. NPDC050663 TaxID=3364370 RepID=UPI00379DEFC0